MGTRSYAYATICFSRSNCISRSRFRSIFSISGLNIAILSLFPH